MTEPKYRIVARNNGVDLHEGMKDWGYSPFDEVVVSPEFENWDAAMAEAIELGIGRKTGESGTFELDQGVEIKAVKE